MILLKTMVCSGVYYLQRGTSDRESWMKLMRDEFGTELEPHLPELYQNSLATFQRLVGPQTGKRNCWDFKECRQAKEASETDRSGYCPASTESRLDGVHGGTNAGRCCWVISGTRCDGGVQNVPEEKRRCCGSCRFIDEVKREEGAPFLLEEDHLNLMVSYPTD